MLGTLKPAFQILVIEDNPADVRLLQEVFNDLNANVTIRGAKDGTEGLAMLAGSHTSPWRPDLVLLDLNLPKLSGHEVLAKLKENPSTCRIPVIVLTSSRAEADIKRAYDFHANAYLRKPTTLEGLFKTAGHITDFWVESATLAA